MKVWSSSAGRGFGTRLLSNNVSRIPRLLIILPTQTHIDARGISSRHTNHQRGRSLWTQPLSSNEDPYRRFSYRTHARPRAALQVHRRHTRQAHKRGTHREIERQRDTERARGEREKQIKQRERKKEREQRTRTRKQRKSDTVARKAVS